MIFETDIKRSHQGGREGLSINVYLDTYILELIIDEWPKPGMPFDPLLNAEFILAFSLF